MSIKPTLADHPKKKHLSVWITLIAIFVIVAAGLGIGYLYYKSQVTKIDKQAERKLQEVLTTTTEAPKTTTIQSGFGFAVTYDKKAFTSYGFVSNTAETRPGYVSGEEFQNDELSKKRNYSIVRLTRVNNDMATTSFSMKQELAISTNFRKNYFDRQKTDAKFANMSDLDMLAEREKETVKKNGSEYSIASSQKIKVNGREYYKVIVERKTKLLDTVTSRWEYRYLTVNDGSPYWVSVGPSLRDEELRDIPLYESIIADISYTKHDDNSLVRTKQNAKLAVSADSDLKDTNKVQGSVDSSALIKVVARNQIASVRVGAIRCADFSFKSENGMTFSLKNACNGGIGSGSIISSDGYVITNGHVVHVSDEDLISAGVASMTPEAWNSYYDYLITGGYIARNELGAYYDKAKQGDKVAAELISKLILKTPASNITIQNNDVLLDIQTSDEPMRVEKGGDRPKWRKTTGNITDAKLIDFEVDADSKKFSRGSDKTDVAIIKMAGTYPTVSAQSLNTIKIDDSLITIGYPWISDKGLETNQTKTVPTVSQGRVIDGMKDGGGHRMVYSDVQIASGNSGGPAFNIDGKQVGINTYGGSVCPDEQDGNACFGRGISRNIDDALDMMKKNNIKISSNDEISQKWDSGLTYFVAGDYARAKQDLQTVDAKYPNNYMVKKILSIAESQSSSSESKIQSDYAYVQTSENASLTQTLGYAFIGVAIAVATMSFISIVIYLKHKPVVANGMIQQTSQVAYPTSGPPNQTHEPQTQQPISNSPPPVSSPPQENAQGPPPAL